MKKPILLLFALALTLAAGCRPAQVPETVSPELPPTDYSLEQTEVKSSPAQVPETVPLEPPPADPSPEQAEAEPGPREPLPLELLPAGYSLEQAKEDGCVVFENSHVTSGQEVWDAFCETAAAGNEATVRLGEYYTLDPDLVSPELYAREKDSYPVLYIQDLTFDGTQYTLRWYEDGKELVRQYEYMMRYEGDVGSFYWFDHYVEYILTHDDTVTWEQIQRSMVSSDLRDYIDFNHVYSDLT